MPQTVTGATVKEASDKRPDGLRVGQSAADLVGFWGATPVAQRSNIADVATTAITTASTTTSPAGFATTTQADNLTTIVASLVSKFNTLLSDLETIGTHASS